MKFEAMVFTDGNTTTDFVGPVKDFKGEQDFINFCVAELGMESDEDVELEELVDIDYVRYYPNGKEELPYFEGGYYTFCSNKKGAIEVYRIKCN